MFSANVCTQMSYSSNIESVCTPAALRVTGAIPLPSTIDYSSTTGTAAVPPVDGRCWRLRVVPVIVQGIIR